MELLSVIAMTSFGPWGLPHLVHKFYAVSDRKAVRKATWIATLFCLLIPCCAYFTGSLAHVFYDLPPMSGGKVMFDTFIPNMLNRYMPEGLMGIILLLILSASMSTLSSLILVSASAGAIDLYEEKVDPSLSQKRSLLFMRVLSGVFIVLSCLLAKYGLSVIVTMMSLSWGAVAGAFMAPFLYGLYWKRATPGGVLAGMVSALLVDIVLFFSLGQEMAPFAACVAMAAPFVVVPLVSLMTPPPPAEVVERAFAGTR